MQLHPDYIAGHTINLTPDIRILVIVILATVVEKVVLAIFWLGTSFIWQFV